MANYDRYGRLNRLRRWRPDLTGGFIAEVDRFAGWIGDGIIAPWRDLVSLAVADPGVTRPTFGNQKTAPGIGDDINPWGRRMLLGLGVESDDVFLPIFPEAAQAIFEEQFGKL